MKDETFAEVKSGLQDGEEVVLNPRTLLSDKERRPPKKMRKRCGRQVRPKGGPQGNARCSGPVAANRAEQASRAVANRDWQVVVSHAVRGWRGRLPTSIETIRIMRNELLAQSDWPPPGWPAPPGLPPPGPPAPGIPEARPWAGTCRPAALSHLLWRPSFPCRRGKVRGFNTTSSPS